MSEPARPLKEISHLRGLSGPIMFAMDTTSAPGKVIVHFLRLETIEFTDGPDFDATTLNVLHPDSDARLVHLSACFGGAT